MTDNRPDQLAGTTEDVMSGMQQKKLPSYVTPGQVKKHNL